MSLKLNALALIKLSFQYSNIAVDTITNVIAAKPNCVRSFLLSRLY